MLNFQIMALHGHAYSGWFHLDDQQLAQMGIVRMRVSSKPGFPCRISLQDAEIGEEVLLINYLHHDTPSPYRASGPVFIRKDAVQAKPLPNQIPSMLIHRLLSIRAYDAQGMMLEARTLHGRELGFAIQGIFHNQQISYIHIHNAGPGCYNCRANRTKR